MPYSTRRRSRKRSNINLRKFRERLNASPNIMKMFNINQLEKLKNITAESFNNFKATLTKEQKRRIYTSKSSLNKETLSRVPPDPATYKFLQNKP